MSSHTQEVKGHASGKRWAISAVLFIVVALIGLFWAKWNPYFHKVFLAASTHNIGKSIVTGGTATAEAPSLAAAWHYSLTYFNAIWKAFIVGIVLGSLVQVLLPADWIQRVLGKTTYGSTLAAGVTALPGMM
ncbi:MAG TPA: hypothetical protein VFH42_02620 [Sporolactobacillaceae bacterium]|nr:hypothetical protein [Sporolactobacillaceae bacterium]